MITKRTVFVLGAGSMADYGFPTGWQLVRDVVHGLTVREPGPRGLRPSQITDFVRSLDGSAQNSVDAFLEERAEFLDIGIAAISLALIRCENAENLYRERDPSKNWLRNLLMRLRGTSFEEIGSNAVSFVTFTMIDQ